MAYLGGLLGGLLLAGILTAQCGPLVVERAKAYEGIREREPNDGPQVAYFLAMVDIHEPSAWCGGFGYTLRAEAGCPPPGPAKQYAWVPSWRKPGTVIWERASNQRPDPGQIQPGDVALFWYIKLGRLAHLGTVTEVRKDGVFLMEGNTNIAGSREGQGVYLHWRPFNTIHTIVRP